MSICWLLISPDPFSTIVWVGAAESTSPTGGPCRVVVVQSLSRVRLFATPRTAACQASLSFTISWSLLKLMSVESMMPSNHLILCCSLLLQPSMFPSIRVFNSELALCIRRPRYWSFSFSISPSNEYNLASMQIEGNCVVVCTFFGTALPWDWKERPFSVLWPLPSFPNLLTY